jgi:GT2 family glycosyltransferase
MDLSLVILNYKQRGLVKQCLKGIFASQPQLEYEVIVVDNDSGDGCLAMVDQLVNEYATPRRGSGGMSRRITLPPVQRIAASHNGGFAFGNNLGIRAATGRYVVVMNPDVAVVSGALEELVAFADAHPEIGILGPRLINPDGSVQLSCRRFPRLSTPLYRRTMFGKFWFAKSALTNYLMTDWDHNKTTDVDWLFGAFLLIRKTSLEKIGLFDERFFLYFEDLDFCRRCWAAGFSVVYYPDVELVHYHHQLSAESAGIAGLLRRGGRMHVSSGIKYFAKYLGVALPHQLDTTPRQKRRSSSKMR